MGKTTIEWTDASWNPVTGCKEISPGCANCYAARLAATRLKNHPDYKGLAINQNLSGQDLLHQSTQRWTGEVRLHPDRLEEPLHWRKPRKIFVCDMSDLFHEDVPKLFICKIFDVIARCPQHTFQILTKRPKDMLAFFNAALLDIGDAVKSHPQLTPQQLRVGIGTTCNWPLPNVWLGTSVEHQHFADERIPFLLQTPAAVRFLSCEPLLGPVNLLRAGLGPKMPNDAAGWLHWVICGGESGPGARPMHPDWARSLRDQCQAAGVPFFFKQWGEWFPLGQVQKHDDPKPKRNTVIREFSVHDKQLVASFGKKASGRRLDGREWNEFPSSF